MGVINTFTIELISDLLAKHSECGVARELRVKAAPIEVCASGGLLSILRLVWQVFKSAFEFVLYLPE